MPLAIRLRESGTVPIEVDSIRLETVREQSLDRIKATAILVGNAQATLGECFDVAGSADDNQIVWSGDCSQVKSIGRRMTTGTLRVDGNAGMHLGAEMSGGDVIVTGNVSDWAGAEMRGGSICIHGNAGNLVGAVYRGGRRGMTGGEILIHGHAGHEIGHAMRRGLIAVGGSAGDAIGSRMIAGSIFVCGAAGRHHGAGMRRGTIGLFGSATQGSLLPTFRYGGRYQGLFLQLYWKHLANAGFPVPPGLADQPLDRYFGDFLELGRGEILTAALAG